MSYTHSVCVVHVWGHTWVFQECCSLSWIHWPGQISAILPRLSRFQVDEEELSACVKFVLNKLTGAVLCNAELYSYPPCGRVVCSWRYALSLNLALQVSNYTFNNYNKNCLSPVCISITSTFKWLARWMWYRNVLYNQRRESTGLSQPSPKRSDLNNK